MSLHNCRRQPVVEQKRWYRPSYITLLHFIHRARRRGPSPLGDMSVYLLYMGSGPVGQGMSTCHVSPGAAAAWMEGQAWPSPRRHPEGTRPPPPASGYPRCDGRGAGGEGQLRSFSSSLPLRMKDAQLVDALVGVRAEVVTLCLDQVGRQAFTAIRIVVGQRGAHRGSGDA
jgi:hypothetical protein